MKTLFLLLISLTLLQANTLRETKYAYVRSSIGQGQPHFVEFGSDSCHSCQIMGKTLYQFKTKSPSYNIEFVNVKRERYVAQELKIRMIPTQMIFDGEGNIVFKNVGLLTTQQLKDLFKKYKFK